MNRRHLGLLLSLLLVAHVVSADAPPQPLSPEESMKLVDLVPGYRIELVASEPHVVDPVAFAWDADGRLFVAEMGDYPMNPGGGRIKLLADRDHDGVMDEHIVFAEGMPFPNGILPYQGGLLVTAAPDILFLKDTDGDGRADHREVILTGFNAANQQLRVNGLMWGLDGWIHAANGRNGGQVTSPKRPDQPAVSVDQHDVRFRPDTGEVQATAGFSQFGSAFDAKGERFINWNTMPIRHVVFPLDVVARHPAMPPINDCEILEDPRQGNVIFPSSARPATFNKEPAGYFNASCGLSIEQGGICPSADAGSAFVCEPLFNMVHRRVLKKHGSTFVAERPPTEQEREFLASRDPWFRPVYTTTGPDGALYVADFYRQWVEHPDFVREDLRAGVVWDTGKDRGRIYRIRPIERPLGKVIPLANASSAECVDQLASTNGWHRLTARRLLRERGDRSVDDRLRDVLTQHPSAIARLEALSLLGTSSGSTYDVLVPLQDADPAVRKWGLRLMREGNEAARGGVERLLSSTNGLLTRLMDDPDAGVRFELALLAEQFPPERRVQVLSQLIRVEPADAWIDRAVLCLADVAPDEIARAVATSPLLDPRELELLRTLCQTMGRSPLAEEVSKFARLIAGWKESEGRSLAAWAGWLRGRQEAKQPIPTEWNGRPMAEMLVPARGLVDRATEPALRLYAVEIVGHDLSAEATQLLTRLLAESRPLEESQVCLRSLRLRSGPEVAAGILSAWPAASPSLKREMVDVLLQRVDRIPALLDAIENGTVAETEFEPDTKKRILEADPAEQKERAARLIPAASADRSAVVQSVLARLPSTGDQAKGRDVFVKHCAGCHRSGDIGQRVGPELAGMVMKSREQLVEDILDPNKQIITSFIALSVVTSDGVTLTGVIAGETSRAITLKRAEGNLESIDRSSIEEIRSTGKSLMPEGFEQSISPEQLSDLIAFLRNRS